MTTDPNFPPVPIVALGHFNDPRASQCQPEVAKDCSDRFVMESLLVFDPRSAPAATPVPAPTLFPSPAPSGLFPAQACNGDVPYSFVGWTTAEELHSTIDFEGHFWAVVTRDVVPIGEWFDDPNTPDHHVSQPFGRRVCAGSLNMPGGMQAGVLLGTAYRIWDDGRMTPDDVFGPGSGIAASPGG